ncbi:hypothetical protein DSM109990_01362 [Sulfitobacter dubius]|uniref:Uncharacterized protein n=1 Tax=Sulfitobacter dubius TaxID=218673 RepID=A0ABY3ZIP8_9RHOB|nr:hypothetical protein DSM109990_01362 [Sulfitobacter dubius]
MRYSYTIGMWLCSLWGPEGISQALVIDEWQ